MFICCAKLKLLKHQVYFNMSCIYYIRFVSGHHQQQHHAARIRISPAVLSPVEQLSVQPHQRLRPASPKRILRRRDLGL